MPYRFIAIEGNIGAGKTTLAEKLAADRGAKLLLEKFHENIFLPRFYRDPEKYAFPVEVSFLLDRYRQLKGDLFAGGEGSVVSDYMLDKCRIFAQVNLPAEEFDLFRQLFEELAHSLPRPDLVLFLSSGVERLQTHIRRRGRAYEMAIPDRYLYDIGTAYEAYFTTYTACPVLYLDVSEMHLETYSLKYIGIQKLLAKTWAPGFHAIKI